MGVAIQLYTADLCFKKRWLIKENACIKMLGKYNTQDALARPMSRGAILAYFYPSKNMP
jgi:hypothetical protein